MATQAGAKPPAAAKGNRAARVRAAAKALETKFKVEFRTSFESGSRWHLDWLDGPSYNTVIAQLKKLDVADADIRPRRNFTIRTYGLAAIRTAAAGGKLVDVMLSTTRFTTQHLDYGLRDVEYPERAVDREERMVTRLLAEEIPSGPPWHIKSEFIVELVAKRGIGWLLTTPPAADGEAAAQPELTPIEFLTSVYSQGETKWRWERQAHTMGRDDAIAAAAADEQITEPAALAVLQLLTERRAEQAQAEATAIGIARQCGASWEHIGQALGGVTEEEAQSRATAVRADARKKKDVRP